MSNGEGGETAASTSRTSVGSNKVFGSVRGAGDCEARTRDRDLALKTAYKDKWGKREVLVA